MIFTKLTLKRCSALLLAALLVLALYPKTTYAAGASISPGSINEANIRSGGTVLTITLDNTNNWALGAGSAKTAKCNALVAATVADTEPEQWDKVKATLTNNADAFFANGNTLTITLPAARSYDIEFYQSITINIPSSLLENSSDPVSTPLTLTIKAESEAFLSGNAKSADEADVIRGGKSLSIELNNGSWADVVNNTTNREKLFDCLKASSESTEWAKVRNALKAAEPNAVISLSDDGRTATIRFPAVSSYNIAAAQTIKLDTVSLRSLVTVDGTLKNSQPSFTIKPSDSYVSLSGSALSASESDIRATENTLVISLSDNSWAPDIASNETKRNALFDAMTATAEQAQWTKVTATLKTHGSLALQLSDGKKTLTITLPAVADYNIASDQTININAPTNLLEDGYRLNTMSFTITADKTAKVTGTIMTANETDIASGGKTIVITLTNAKWADNIHTNRIKRETLIDKFTCYDPAWQQLREAIKASGSIKRDSDTKVTITLPPVSTFNITSDLTIDLEGISADESLVYNNAGTAVAVSALSGAFTIKAVTGQTAAISGTIMSKTSELDMARGGKTITVTLKDDVWAADIESQSAQLLTCFEVISGSSTDKAAWDAAIAEADVTLVSPSTINVKLPAIPYFDISSNITVQMNIDYYLLSAADMPVTASPSFMIYATTVDISGTALSGTLDAPAVEKGGKTIIITLNNGAWVPNVISDSANLTALLNAFSGEAWEPIKGVLQQNPRNITVRNNQLTIKLPPIPGYNESGAVSLTVPKELIVGSNSDIAAPSDINIGTAASASISPDLLLESEVVHGGAEIEIKLASNKWLPDMISNKQSINTLIKAFSPVSQADQWEKVTAAVAALNPSDLVSLSADKTQLTLRLPAVADYDIIQDQKINIVIPKTLLASADAEINAGSITIENSKPFGVTNFNSALNDGTLAGWLDGISPSDIYIVVPQKHIYTIDIAHTMLGSSYLTDITVTTSNDVAAVIITAGATERTVSSYKVSGDKRIFNAGFANLSQGADVAIRAVDNGSNIIQEGIVKKIVNGINSYSEVPKADLSGTYSLHNLLIDSKLLNSILQYYRLSDLSVGIS